MSSPASASVSLQELLDARKNVPAAEALQIFGRLLDQVRALHAAGQVHRRIVPRSVVVRPGGDLVLLPAEPHCRLGGTAGDEPPELYEVGEVVLPSDRGGAARALAQAGLGLDPVRIDVFQLGVLLCRLLTGQPVAAYLHSPRAKAEVPPGLQPVIDRALGFDPARRCADCDELAAALAAARAGLSAVSTDLLLSPSVEALSAQPACLDDTPHRVVAPRAGPEAGAPVPYDQLGRYRILERLGQGGMGDVYLGFEEALQRRVALKVLPPELARNDDFVRRFHAEATAVAGLEHPNIVPMYGVGQEGDVAFFVMQYVEGESLEQRLARRGRLEVEETLDLLEQCLAGLRAAHEAGLVHRDIKPGNILLHGKTGRALVADFGLVKTSAAGTRATATGVILGTVDYIAPEQARGLAVDGRADLYSVGVMAFRMLSGRLPFQASTPTAMIFQHAYEPPPSLNEVAPDIPVPVVLLVGRLMAKDPADRYPGCADVLADIQRYRAGEPLAGLPAAYGDVLALQGVDLSVREQPGRVRWWRRAGELFLAHAPQLLMKQATIQQVDRALALCQQRRDALARLVEEAQDAAALLAEQARTCRAEAAESSRLACEPVAATLDRQAAEQEKEAEKLRLRLAEADITLGKMRQQRDLLHARLWLAEARLPGKVGRPRHRRTAAVLGLVVGAAVLLGLGSSLLRTTATRGTGSGVTGGAPRKEVEETGCFHLLGQGGVARGRYATLTAAVEAAAAGDTIDVHENGPLVCGFVQVKVPLRIRAADGTRPVITFQPAPVQEWWRGLLQVSAPLVLEGVELRYHRPTLGGVIQVIEATSELRMTNCRVVAQGEANALFLRQGSAELHRCEVFTGPWAGIRWNLDAAARLVLNDCIVAGGEVLVWHSYQRQQSLPNLDVRLNRCTLLGERAVVDWLIEQLPPAPPPEKRVFHVAASLCVFALASADQGLLTVTGAGDGTLQDVRAARNLLQHAVSWQDDRNLYPEQRLLAVVNASRDGKLLPVGSPCATLAEWSRFWELSRPSSTQGVARFQEGDIFARLQTSFPALLPRDFRLAKGSPGQGAGLDGSDRGARVEFVGPGTAYHTWQKTPDYQLWRQQAEVLLKRPSS